MIMTMFSLNNDDNSAIITIIIRMHRLAARHGKAQVDVCMIPPIDRLPMKHHAEDVSSSSSSTGDIKRKDGYRQLQSAVCPNALRQTERVNVFI